MGILRNLIEGFKNSDNEDFIENIEQNLSPEEKKILAQMRAADKTEAIEAKHKDSGIRTKVVLSGAAGTKLGKTKTVQTNEKSIPAVEKSDVIGHDEHDEH